MHSVTLNLCLQLIEGLISFEFYESIKTQKKKMFNALCIFWGYIVMFVINLLFNYNLIVNTIVLMVFQFVFSFALYKLNWLFSIFYSILFTVLVTITELSVSETIIAALNLSSRDIVNNESAYIVMIIMCKSLLFLLLKIISTIINKFQATEKLNISNLIYPASLLVAVTGFGFVTYSQTITNNLRMILSVASLILIVSVILTCLLQQLHSKKEAELLELRAAQQKQELNNTYFELLEHQNNELQIFVHDTKKHYHTLYEMVDEPQRLREYIQGIVTDIENVNKIGKTTNKHLDLILSKAVYICKKNNIYLDLNIHNSDLTFIEDRDLTSLLNNLLDNATDAAKSSKNKSVAIGINKIANMLVIDVTNSCDTPPKVKNNKLISTKQSDGLHGYGFKSICKVVKKYEGDIEWEYNPKSKEFVVSIIFPLKKGL